MNSPEFPIHCYLAHLRILFSLRTTWQCFSAHQNIKKKLGAEECCSLKIISFPLKIHKPENIGQQKYDNKLFPVHRKCVCQLNNLPASWYQYIQLSANAMHVQTRLNLLLRQHIRLRSKLKFLLRNTCVTRKVQCFFLRKPDCSLLCINACVSLLFSWPSRLQYVDFHGISSQVL